MKTTFWIFFCYFLVGVVCQIPLPPTGTGTATGTVTNSNSNSNSNSGTWTNSNSGTWTNSNSGTWTNSNSGTWTNSDSGTWTNSNSITFTTSVTQTDSFSVTVSGTYSLSYTPTETMTQANTPSVTQPPSLSRNAFNTPFDFLTDPTGKRPQNIQCAYKPPNLFCKWTPGSIPYKRIRLEVVCTSSSPVFLNQSSIISYRAVSNTSTPLYTRGFDTTLQQRSLVSLDLPPQMPCKGVLAVKMYTNRIGRDRFDNKTGVTYTRSRFWFVRKLPPGDTFQTAPFVRPF